MAKRYLTICIALMGALCASAFAVPGIELTVKEPAEPDTLSVDSVVAPRYESLADSLLAESHPEKELMSLKPMPRLILMPAIYTQYAFPDTASVFTPDYSGADALKWVEDEISSNERYQNMLRSFMLNNPGDVRYNVLFLPEVPKQYKVTVNPEDHTIAIDEVVPKNVAQTDLVLEEVKKVHWLKTFNASLQFSQAYVSPNWYQGGNNNLNAILNLYYNVKLNPAYHKNLLFESTFQYKLGINSTPDDSLRKYNVSEDIFQINSVFGYKAAKKWYYSVNAQFKTQLVDAYTVNTRNLRSAFLSPGELNVGLGMTYNTINPQKTFSFDASIAPLSYNLMVCTDNRLNVTSYGIEPGKHSVSKFGSSIECKLMWKMTRNITYNSRVFGFTNYKRIYADWENTFVFEINRFLTTQIFVHLRYDTDTPVVENPHWHKLQVKEILSMGFSYKFSTK